MLLQLRQGLTYRLRAQALCGGGLAQALPSSTAFAKVSIARNSLIGIAVFLSTQQLQGCLLSIFTCLWFKP